MKNVAIGILVVILASVLIQPMSEVLNLTKEKIVIGSALTNAARAARDRSLVEEFQRNLDARIDEKKFSEYFAEVFEDALNLTCTNKGMNAYYLTFDSNNDRYNDFTVTLEYTEEEDEFSDHIVKTTIKMRAESEYKFQTKFLKMAEDAGEDVAYQLVADRTLILTIKN